MSQLTKIITVLSPPVIEKSEPGADRKWIRASMQIWTGTTAGTMQIYGDIEKPEVIQSLTQGQYQVDIIERHGRYQGQIEMAFGNPVPHKPAQTPATKA